MEEVKNYYLYTNYEANFREICEMDDSDPELTYTDIKKNLYALIKSARNDIFQLICLADWIIKFKIPITPTFKNYIIKNATPADFTVLRSGKMFSMSEIMTTYENGEIAEKYKGYIKCSFSTYSYVAEEQLRIIMKKFNHNKFRTIPKKVFEYKLEHMLIICINNESMIVFGMLLMKSGAIMDKMIYNFIMDEILKINKFHAFEAEVDKYYLNQMIN